MNMTHKEYIINSALWAAYGDALGFITELADDNTLKWRINSIHVNKTIPWKRRIGGRFGVIIELPAGCYSDDTQLRLATSRAIRGDGKFDVEAFSKIEIPVWLSYALGAGKGSKTAAASLAKKDITWTNNFYEIKNFSTRYVDNGGNGAAMRIQPHVWVSNDRKNLRTFIPDVIRNAICTHGHPRGIAGAVFHALCLAHALQFKSVPGPDDWKQFVNQVRTVSNYIRLDNELNDYWLPVWEKAVGSSVETSFDGVADECMEDIIMIQKLSSSNIQIQYPHIVKELGGFTPEHRGSGTKTAIIAVMLAWAYRENPSEAIKVAANLLGSDTDSIATMAGAILGATIHTKPEGDICDRSYIESEAARLSDISNNLRRDSFIYPDLLKWDAPIVQLDMVGVAHGRLAVSGLGYTNPSRTFGDRKTKQDTVWEWLELCFGQNILAKQRSQLVSIPLSNLPIQQNKTSMNDNTQQVTQGNLFKNVDKDQEHLSTKLTFGEARKRILDAKFDPVEIGKIILEFAQDAKDGAKFAARFSEIIVKEYIARQEKEKRKNC